MSAQYHAGVLQMSSLNFGIWKMFIIPLEECSARLPKVFSRDLDK
jgi:hypothetical protein